jgi:hypothetical protein
MIALAARGPEIAAEVDKALALSRKTIAAITRLTSWTVVSSHWDARELAIRVCSEVVRFDKKPSPILSRSLAAR